MQHYLTVIAVVANFVTIAVGSLALAEWLL
jgi:hypothetical protein